MPAPAAPAAVDGACWGCLLDPHESLVHTQAGIADCSAPDCPLRRFRPFQRGELGPATDVKRDQGKTDPAVHSANAPPGSFAWSGHDRPHAPQELQLAHDEAATFERRGINLQIK